MDAARALTAGFSIPTRQGRPSARGLLTARSPPKLTSAPRLHDVAGDLYGLVDGVLLADPAEVELHARWQPQFRSAPLHLVPADQWQERVDFRLRRNTRSAVESPCATQHPGGHVEEPVRQVVERRGEIEQLRGLLVNRYGATTGGIDFVDDVAAAVAAVLVLDSPRAVRDPLCDHARLRRIEGLDQHFARAGHGAEPTHPERVLDGEFDAACGLGHDRLAAAQSLKR